MSISQINKHQSLLDFLQIYQNDLKSSAPVKTGTLRDSLTVIEPQIENYYNIPVEAVYYAKYVNGKYNFVGKNDYDIEVFATDYTEAMWEDLYKSENNKTKNINIK